MISRSAVPHTLAATLNSVTLVDSKGMPITPPASPELAMAGRSCRNRHCPKCQALTKARWLQARKAELLPATYFHNVFTLPHEINPIALCNKKVVFGILFKSVSQTILQFGKNPKNGLGGKLGFIAILHTWDQTLMDHFHLHVVIPGGALSFDNDRWIADREDFLFHVKALSGVFQGKFIDYFQRAFANGELIFPGDKGGTTLNS
jgi:hypothetical protein